MLSKLIRDIQQKVADSPSSMSIAMTELSLENLQEEPIQEMLLDLLAPTDLSRAKTLASICQEKTDGSPLYLKQYVSMLHEQGLLQYSSEVQEWVWDEKRIQTETQATQNVARMLQERMSALPSKSLQILQIAACLGECFHEQSLLHAWSSLLNHSPSEMVNPLAFAVKGGILKKSICRDSLSLYEWTNCQMLEASIVMLSAEELNKLKFGIVNFNIDYFMNFMYI